MWKNVIYVVVAAAVVCFLGAACADVVLLRNGKRMKGLILEDYKDRIIFSTVGGEMIIKKPDIQAAAYDSKGKELIRRGRNQIEKGRYISAYHTYEKAVELEPGILGLDDRLHFLRGFVEKKTGSDIVDSMLGRDGGAEEDPVRVVADEIGLDLAPGGEYVSVARVAGKRMEAAEPRIEPGDKIVAVWGEETAYMDVEEVAEKLLVLGEIKLAIERTVVPGFRPGNPVLDGLFFGGYKRITGAVIKLYKQGVVVEKVIPGGPFESAGIEEGDLLYKINARKTRYMPMTRIIDIFRSNRGKEVEMVIRRDITLWRKQSRL